MDADPVSATSGYTRDPYGRLSGLQDVVLLSAASDPAGAQELQPCWRRTGISGRYEGTRAGSPQAGHILDLRIDVDRRYTSDSPIMNRVSGDFYIQRFVSSSPGPAAPQRTYTESWIVDRPQVEWSSCQAVITGMVRYWKGVHPATTVRITVPWSDGAINPATVQFTSGGTVQSGYTCAFRSEDFRSVFLELDCAASVATEPRRPSYDTHSHDNRPPDLSRRVLTIEDCYREAGVGVTMSQEPTVIDDSAAGFNTWSVGELHDAMKASFSRYTSIWPDWNMWGMQAGTFDDPLTGGIMFDAAAGFGGAGRSPDRQGFAVFRNHRWFADLASGAPADQDHARAMRHFLYTWVHEAGHAFNFLHSWNKARPSSLSWMNYDWKYDQLGVGGDFWANFRFRFDDEELIHLRHGDRAAVIMGGDPWASGGHLEAPSAPTLETGPDEPVELLLRSKKYFEFMEPVEIEFRLRNRTPVPLTVDARLDPKYGNSTVLVLRPDGRTTQFNSVICLYGTPEMRILAPSAGGDASEGSDRYSELVPVTFGERGFVFDEPGQYQLRAVYSANGLLTASNTVVFRIGQPMTKEADRFAADYFSQEVGLTLSFDGSMSPFLAKGLQTLTEAAERFTGEDLGNKAAKVVAKSVGDDFFRRKVDADQDEMVKHHTADPAAALAVTEPALEGYHAAEAPATNIAYSELVQLRAGMHVQKGDPEIGRRELETLSEDLGRRGVNDNVLEDIRSLAADLPAATGTTARRRKATSPRRKTTGG